MYTTQEEMSMDRVYVVTSIKTGRVLAVFEDSHECISYVERSTKDTVHSCIVKFMPKGYKEST